MRTLSVPGPVGTSGGSVYLTQTCRERVRTRDHSRTSKTPRPPCHPLRRPNSLLLLFSVLFSTPSPGSRSNIPHTHILGLFLHYTPSPLLPLSPKVPTDSLPFCSPPHPPLPQPPSTYSPILRYILPTPLYPTLYRPSVGGNDQGSVRPRGRTGWGHGGSTVVDKVRGTGRPRNTGAEGTHGDLEIGHGVPGEGVRRRERDGGRKDGVGRPVKGPGGREQSPSPSGVSVRGRPELSPPGPGARGEPGPSPGSGPRRSPTPRSPTGTTLPPVAEPRPLVAAVADVETVAPATPRGPWGVPFPPVSPLAVDSAVPRYLRRLRPWSHRRADGNYGPGSGSWSGVVEGPDPCNDGVRGRGRGLTPPRVKGEVSPVSLTLPEAGGGVRGQTPPRGGPG